MTQVDYLDDFRFGEDRLESLENLVAELQDEEKTIDIPDRTEVHTE